jgi:tRNA pseudouridine55 synthase
MTIVRTKRFDRHVDGIVLLDKPQGVSSNAALQSARALFRALKAGHAGSLDPLATGMLPVCFGQATKVCGYLLDSYKTYRVAMKLGQRTDSADADGVVIEEQPVPTLTHEQILAAMQTFIGPQQQVPPMFSALKVQGKRLYELARSGETVERAARNIVIERLELLANSADSIEFEVRCSKGTYVRSLVEDLAARIGTLAHVTMLRRVQVDPFDAARMLTLEQLEQMSAAERDAQLLPPDSALVSIPEVELVPAQVTALFHGKVLHDVSSSGAGLHRAYGPERRFLGLVTVGSDGQVTVERLFNEVAR